MEKLGITPGVGIQSSRDIHEFSVYQRDQKAQERKQ